MTNARELSLRLAELLRKEHDALAAFLLALAAFDREQRWRELGHPSLFGFLNRELGLSKGAAFYRMTAAQLIQRHPEILEPLRDGRLCLTTGVELSKVITPENAAAVLPRFLQLSKREAKEVVAELSPTPAPVRMVVTALPAPEASREFALPLAGTAAPAISQLTPVSWPDEPPHAKSEHSTQAGRPHSVTVPLTRPAMAVEPKSAEQSRIHLTVSRAFLRKLEAARDALSHSRPGASADEILEAGLDLLLERSAKRKGLVKNPRKSPVARRPRAADPRALAEPPDTYVPAHVRREVWKRDQGRCQFPLERGGVCGSTYQVELDHVIPVAKGGRSDPPNLRCACKPHNLEAARRELGDAVMDRYASMGPLSQRA